MRCPRCTSGAVVATPQGVACASCGWRRVNKSAGKKGRK
jgi:DNA-directed RNA polymerase subunit RPC12/RpoP